jgi:hypothetical protein
MSVALSLVTACSVESPAVSSDAPSVKGNAEREATESFAAVQDESVAPAFLCRLLTCANDNDCMGTGCSGCVWREGEATGTCTGIAWVRPR